jgi:branched-chain amino acid transport system substrate-binding protein
VGSRFEYGLPIGIRQTLHCGFKIQPDQNSAWTYDAIGVLCASINKAGSTDPGKIRDAILSTKGYNGAEGEYNFDELGDGLHGYNVVRNEKGTIIFDKHIEFTD